jgi:glycoprotein-N-acetylgalactosamine 3-beta-galactosyltransferase
VYTISPRHHNAASQLRSWGKRCDGFIAWSNLTDETISALRLHNVKTDGAERYDEMWSKTQNIWSVVASSDLIHQFQYFYLAGDDVYVLVDNLRRYLSSPHLRALSRDNALPLYLGRRVPHNHYLFYHTGESGYVLNAVAVRALVHHLKEAQCFDELSVSMEDVMAANCLRHSVGLEALDSRDSAGSERFHTTNLSAVQKTALMGNRYEGMVKNGKLGLRSVSTQSISFHDMAAGQYMRCVDEHLDHVL